MVSLDLLGPVSLRDHRVCAVPGRTVASSKGAKVVTVEDGVDINKPWYHGSPRKLDVLQAGSTMTQWRDLARVFSHKPPIVSISDERRIQHNGTRPGYLYEVAEPVAPEDVEQHPRTTMPPGDEWLTHRELRLCLIGETTVRCEEFLSDAAMEAIKRWAASRS